ncbi:putative F-box protein At4g09190 isoform X2 [Cornus florida]|uniref:putative F-box protein At4g09190 isoform X2 n=1 Tax=Cornus florida TaxID=4283 RepID=UPI002896A565|nr:putative F-box protein At4g09190 isoform X2 [Cornus florida]
MSSSSGPRRSARLAHRSIDSKSSVRCGYTDRNAHSLLLKEMAGVDCIPKKRRNTKGSLPFLPEEVVYNILVFVPAEILYNVMRYVCQAWCNVINNPEFINAHLQKSTSGILIQHWDEDHPEVIHFVEINNCDVWTRELRYGFSRPICASCDGLVLFPHDSNDLLFRVGNPITKQILTLPPLVGPIFHDTRSALVYVHSIRRYKVVIVFRVNSLEFKCAILTVGAETAWRLIDTKHIPCANVYLFESSPLSAGEYLYWTPNSRACSYLLALDVEAEIMHQLPDPKIFKEKGGYFLATENFLALMVRRKEFLWEVWVLTELHTGICIPLSG